MPIVVIVLIINRCFDEWAQAFGLEHLCGALLDRLTHHVCTLEMNVQNYGVKLIREQGRAPGSGRPGRRLTISTPQSAHNI